MRTRRPGGEYSLRVLGVLVSAIQQRLGETAVDAVAAAAGVSRQALQAGTQWVPLAQLEQALQRAGELLDCDEERFKQLCVAQMPDAYGALKYMLWATTPDRVLRLAVNSVHMMSSNSRWQLLEHRANHMRARYTSELPESRWLCLLRQANVAGLPTLWGLPQPFYVEHTCMCRGDACCEYEVWLPVRRGWLAPLLAALAGAALGALLASDALGAAVLVPLLALLGGGLAGYLDLLRTQKLNRQVTQRSVEAVRLLAEEERAARLEALELGARQRELLELLDGQVEQRTAAMQGVLERVQQLRHEQVVSLRGSAHDLAAPVSVLLSTTDELQRIANQLPEDLRWVVPQQAAAAERLRLMVDDILQTLHEHARPIVAARERVVVESLAERLRLRLRALSLRRDVRSSVFCTRDAPTHIEIDALSLDRVLDNLLLNAVKYTERGSIMVELGGTPEHLVVKILDTGRGIAPEAIAKVFTPGGSQPGTRAPDSHGLGLSVVVRLLRRLGGRLEVLSHPDVGTTFWVYLPRVAIASAQGDDAGDLHDDGGLAQVVTIRRPAAG